MENKKSQSFAEMQREYVSRWREMDSEQMRVRLETEKRMLTEKKNPYKNGFTPNIFARDLIQKYSHMSKEEIAECEKGNENNYRMTGRVLLVRSFGKAAFLNFDDGSERFQLYVKTEELDTQSNEEYKFLDYGDIVYAEGSAFKTNKGELSLKVKNFRILTKSLRPLPEKFHGLSDPELRYRMRYVDLIMNPKVRETFRLRSAIVRFIREFFYKRDYLEVDTPMLHPIVGGANAKPFITHHNALNMDMYLRIAPELHLKRLITGGFPRVFEMNRLFRNEGLSIKHNPEFTTIEFYQAYATYQDLIDLTEELLSSMVEKVLNKTEITYGEKQISFARPFQRLTMRQAVAKYTGLELSSLNDRETLLQYLKDHLSAEEENEWKKMSADELLVLAFEEFAEKNLIQPTFITEYPTSISPLSRRNDEHPEFVDRFELFINGWEMANAFSELNNPQDQLERFAGQAARKFQGDEEANDMDYDYVRCLEYGMPPTAGEGIGIDRLCMLLTDGPSIRDVILFPHLKKENFFNSEA